MRRNPISRGRSYFPPWDSGLAYHAITSGVKWDDVEHYFRQVWESQWILSSEALGACAAVMDTDVLAGDHENVFLSISQPLGFQQDHGYYLAFDADKLVRGGAKVGVADLLDGYQDALAAVREEGDWKNYEKMSPLKWPDGMYERFKDLVRLYQENLRFSGYEAQQWINWCMGGGEPEDLTFYARKFTIDMESDIRPPEDIESARRFSEIIVKDHLNLDKRSGLVGVCFRRIYFELDDFYRLFTEGAHERLTTDLGGTCFSSGRPHRCPFCEEPLVPGMTAREVLDADPWVKVYLEGHGMLAVPCEPCGGFVVFGDAMGHDPYEVADEDLLVPFGDLDYSDYSKAKVGRCH